MLRRAAMIAAMMIGLSSSALAATAMHSGAINGVEVASVSMPPLLIRSVSSIPQLTVLPDLQSAHVRPLMMPKRALFRAPAESLQEEESLPDAPSVARHRDAMDSLVGMPVAVRLRRMTNERFNTRDGSFGDFAVCYRLGQHYALQVVPGDPAPVKLPVSTIQNNTGVTVGMVIRVGK